jgi:hypothetical protein
VNEALVLLVLIWAVLLVPSALRSRKASPHATVGGFERAMSVLRTGPDVRDGGRQLMVPGDAGRIVEREVGASSALLSAAPGGRPRAHIHVVKPEDPVIERRRIRFVRLLIATAVTFVAAVFVGGWLWLALVATLGATGGYTVLLRRIKLQRDAARQVVAGLELHAAEPVEVPEAVGVGGWESGTVRLRRWGD